MAQMTTEEALKITQEIARQYALQHPEGSIRGGLGLITTQESGFNFKKFAPWLLAAGAVGLFWWLKKRKKKKAAT